MQNRQPKNVLSDWPIDTRWNKFPLTGKCVTKADAVNRHLTTYSSNTHTTHREPICWHREPICFGRQDLPADRDQISAFQVFPPVQSGLPTQEQAEHVGNPDHESDTLATST